MRVQTCLQHTHTHASGGVSLSLSLVVVVAVLVFAATASKHVSSSSLAAKTKQEDKELCSRSLVLVCKTCFCLRTHTQTARSLALLQNKAHVAAYQPSQPVFSASLTLSQLLLLLFVVVRFFRFVCAALFSCALSVAAASVCCWVCAADVFTGFRFSSLCALFLQDAHVALLLLSLMSDTHVRAHMHTHTQTHGRRRHVRGIRKYAMMEYWTNGKCAMCELKLKEGDKKLPKII